DEADTFTVRSLGTHADPSTGWELECWDLSLASGTHEFYTNIEVTVPRTEEDGSAAGFVCYNEETGKWEELYSKLSEDGSSYQVYMKHFSPLAKRKLLGWKENAYRSPVSDAPNELFNQYGVDAELFVELETCSCSKAYSQTRSAYNDRMETAVRLDYDSFWAMAEQGKLKGIDVVLGRYASGSISIQNAFKELAEVNVSGTGKTLAGLSGAYLNLTDILEAGPPAGTPMARIFGGLGACLGYMDVAAAYTRITYDAQIRQKTITDSILEDHKMDLVSGVTGALSTISGAAAALGDDIPTPVTWGLAAVSLTIYASGQASSALEGYSMSGITDLMFQYYSTHYAMDTVPQLPDLTDRPMRRLSEMLRNSPLTFGTKEDGSADDSWVRLVSNLVLLNKLYPEEVPVEKIPQILDEIIDYRARRFFNLSDSSLQSIWDKARDEKYLDWDYLLYRPIYEGYTQDDVDRLYAYELARLRVAASKAAEQVMESTIQEARKETQEYLDKYLVPQLNKMVVFHVEDAEAEDFSDSAYYRDFYEFPGNQDWKLTEAEAKSEYDENGELIVVDYGDEELMLPMSFADATDAWFLPSQEVLYWDTDHSAYKVERVSANEYFPNADNFIPRAKAYDWDDHDVVFKCTVYHYMMMGCPGAMTFRTYPEEALEKPKAGEEPRSFAPLTEVTVTFASGLDRMEYKEHRKEYHLYIRVLGAISIQAFTGNWVYHGSNFKTTLQISYTLGDLWVYEIYEDADGKDTGGGMMDQYRLDQTSKTLVIGDERLENGYTKLILKDENHITVVSGTGTYDLTKEEPAD
ncbi:MAG: hypothetical protein IKX47_00190, partial [Oscillospiraceae bacterium]|nr:hypothetical protein [Oscillospiraceae bacterium]